MQKSETIGELAKALALAQGEIQNAKKDSENPFFKSKYADLAAVRDACQGPFSKNGLAVIQTPKTLITEDATIIGLETLLCHSSGEWVSEELSAIPVKPDPQGIGSCITYLRRYALASFAGVAAEDDDGNAASHSQAARSTPAKHTPAKQTPAPAKSDIEHTKLKQSVVDVCQLLNAAGDEPKWSAKRVNELAIKEYGLPADTLELQPLRELVKKLSARLDGLKANKPAAAKADSERLRVLATIKAAAGAEEITQALQELKLTGPIENLSLDALVQLDECLAVPF